MTTKSTPPIEFSQSVGELTDRIKTKATTLSKDFLNSLGAVCPSSTTVEDLVEHSRDWWPLAMHWSLNGKTPRRSDVVCRPTSTEQVSEVVSLCAKNSVPVTVSGGRSGVCGAAVPLFAGVVIDTTNLCGVVSVDQISGLIEVRPGTFGPDLENEINSKYKLSVGHFPQSFDISTVGGWIGSRGAGQYSTRYGKIDDMVAGLEIVLADGSVILTGTEPAGAAGPNLTSLFIGSEGTLGVITKVWLRAHPLPAVESKRSHGGDGKTCTLLVLDEGVEVLIDATLKIVGDAAINNHGQPAETELVDNWLHHRNDTSGLQALSKKGFVIDTMEVAVAWSRVNEVADAVRQSIMQVSGARSAS
ncbi:MAG: hypothetical protein RLZZ105_512, partial [Actinomycetota bacterium]